MELKRQEVWHISPRIKEGFLKVAQEDSRFFNLTSLRFLRHGDAVGAWSNCMMVLLDTFEISFPFPISHSAGEGLRLQSSCVDIKIDDLAPKSSPGKGAFVQKVCCLFQ